MHHPYIQNVRVSGQPLKLKHLAIGRCFKLKNVEVSDTGLESFKYSGREPTIRICFENVPQLFWFSLEILDGGCQTYISKFHRDLNLFQVRNLDLHLSYLRSHNCLFFPSNFPEFSKLEKLKLNFTGAESETLLFLTSIIGASPCLNKLTLKYWMSPSREESARQERLRPRPAMWEAFYASLYASFEKRCQEEANRYSYQNLKTIKFVGWAGLNSDVELANFFLGTAVSLEKIIIDLRRPNFVRRPWEKDFLPPLEEVREGALAKAMQLEQKLPPGAKLIILELPL